MTEQVQATPPAPGTAEAAQASLASGTSSTEPKVPATEPTKSTTSLANEKPEGESPSDVIVPDKYEAFKLPDGFEANEVLMTEAQGVFKELGLPQSSAQRLIDLYAKATTDAADAPIKHWVDTQNKWRSEVKADPVIGGSKLNQVLGTISKAIDSFGDVKLAKEFREAMDSTGAGNNPAFIKGFYRMASKLVEPVTHVGGQPAGGKPASAAAAVYPHLPSGG